MKKRIYSILLVTLLLLCACQPTPEEDAVKQKDTNVLIDTVLNDQQDVGKTQPSVKEQFPERFQCDLYTSAQNVHVTADTPIEVLSDAGGFPMLRVERRYLTDAERLTLAQRLLDSEHLYIYEYRMTREILEDLIREYMRELTPEEQKSWMHSTGSSEAELAEMLERRKQIAADYQRQYNELPADGSVPDLLEWFGAAPDYSEDYENHRNDISIVRSATDTMDRSFLDHVVVCANECDSPIEFQTAELDIDDTSTSIWFFNKSYGFGTERIDPKDYNTPHEGASVTPNDAIAAVKSRFAGICDFSATDVYWANNAGFGGDEIGTNARTRWVYCIHFSADYNGAYMPYCKTSALQKDDHQQYVRGWSYEALTAAVDGDGNLISLVWTSPLKVTDVIAESTTLLPFAEIQSIFETQINRVLAGEDNRDGTLTLSAVQLGLFRIREQNNMDAGLLVPVWYFTGVLEYSDVQKELHKDFYVPDGVYYDALNPLLIVNAIDGSIIDPQIGY